MPIEFVCDQCGASLARPYVAAGKATSCDACGKAIIVPKDYAPKDFAAKQIAPPQAAAVASKSGFEAPDRLDAAMAIVRGATPAEMQGDAERGKSSLAALVRPAQASSPGWERPEIFASNVFSQSYALFRGRMRRYVTVNWALVLAVYGPRRMLEVVSAEAADPFSPTAVRALVLVAGVLLYLVSVAWLNTAGFAFNLKMLRGEEPTLMGVLRETKHVLRLMAWSLLVNTGIVLILSLSALPAAAVWFVSHDPRWTALVAAVFVLPAFLGMFWLSLVYSQSAFLIVDRGLGPLESLAASARLTAGNRLELFLINLAVIVSPAAILACGVGVVLAMPFAFVLLSVAYLQLTGYWLDESEGRMRPQHEIPLRRAPVEPQPARTPARPRRRIGFVGLLAFWVLVIVGPAGGYIGYQHWKIKKIEEPKKPKEIEIWIPGQTTPITLPRRR